MRKKELPHTPETAALMSKYRKQLLLTTISAVVSISVIAGATAAWFASNRKVDSTGMAAKVQTSSNLIIGKDLNDLRGRHTSIEFDHTSGIASLVPCRHLAPNDILPTGDSSGPLTSSSSNLYYNTNPQNVDMDSGLLDTEANQLFFKAVPESGEDGYNTYFIDFPMYLAATGGSITASQLTVEMGATVIDPGAETPGHFQAATIDVYIGMGYPTDTGNPTLTDNGISYTYAGTVNVAKKDWKNFTQQKNVPLLPESKTITFPDITGGSGVPVLLRCYFDGGLERDTGKTYIYSNETTAIVGCAMSLSFTATEQEATP